MIDITSANSFSQLSELIPKIYEKMKANLQYGDLPMFFISNKVDLEMKREVSGFDIKELIDHYESMNNYEISLNLEKNASDETINEFIIKLCNTISEQEKKYTFKHDSLNLVRICEPMKLVKESKLMKNVENTLNLLLLGSQAVGKTSFAQKLFSNQFKEETLSTLGIDIESTVAELYGALVKIELWDTVGQERLRSLPQKYYSKGDGFFLLYDVNDKKSFEDVVGWIKDIRKARGGTNEQDLEKKLDDEVLVLIGNKIDKIGKREVTREEAIELANKYNVKYYETSCKQGINLYEILCDIIFQASSSNRRESTRVIMLERENKAKSANAQKKKCC
jgi:small GTP-binding protein